MSLAFFKHVGNLCDAGYIFVTTNNKLFVSLNFLFHYVYIASFPFISFRADEDIHRNIESYSIKFYSIIL